MAQQDIQLQQTVGALGPTNNISKLASQMGTQLAQLGLQRQVSAIQNTAAQVAQTQQQQIGQRKGQLRQQIQGLQAGLSESQQANIQRLSSINEGAKKEILDARRMFAQDELGRKFSNERQLTDYAKLTATRDEDFKNFTQNLELAHDRKKQVLSTALEKITSALKFESAQTQLLRQQIASKDINAAEVDVKRNILNQKLNQELQLKELENQLRKSLSGSAAAAQNRQLRNNAIGTIVGAGIGAAVGAFAVPGVGAAPGAAVGASIGGGLGSLLGS